MIPHNKPTIGAEEIKAAADCIGNLELTMGTKVKEFEKAFTKYIGVNSVATSSGTSALHLALIATGISRNDEVIMPSYTCIAVCAQAIGALYNGKKVGTIGDISIFSFYATKMMTTIQGDGVHE